MSNRSRLQSLLEDILLLSEGEFRFDLRRQDVATWDSRGVVAIATGVEEEFGYHMTEAEAVGVSSVPDLIAVLESHGVSFAE
jgi:acyl carrier protein